MKAVGIYARISSDVLGEGLGVQRQDEDCTALAKARGWRVVDRYIDNDISAFSGKTRPEYERMLTDIKAGRITGIIAWHADRLHRSPKELEVFIDVVEATGATVDTVRAGPLDLATPSGRLFARNLGSFARYESEHKSERIRRKLEQNAKSGRIHGGRRPFGWEDDRVTLRADEAAAVRLATDRVLAGQSIKSVMRELDAAGVTNTEGNTWQHATLRAILLRPRNAGLRQYKGEIVGAGEWQPILDVSTWEDVRRVLTDPSRRTSPGSLGRVHLLSGIAMCFCGAPMRVNQGRRYKGQPTPDVYRCKRASCVSRRADRLEEYVVGLIIGKRMPDGSFVPGRLAQPDASDLITPAATNDQHKTLAELQRLRNRLDGAAADYADDKITADQLRTITARLRPQIETLEALATPPPPPAGALADLVAADDIEAVWGSLDVRQRREVIGLLVDIKVMPTKRGHGEFDYNAVQIKWKKS